MRKILVELTKPRPVQREEHAIRLLFPFQSTAHSVSCTEFGPLMSQLETFSKAASIIAVVAPRRAMWPLPTRHRLLCKATSIIAAISPRGRCVSRKLEKWYVCFAKADADDSKSNVSKPCQSRSPGEYAMRR